MNTTRSCYRAFLAFALPESVRAGLRGHVEALQQLLPSDQVRWIPEENWHLTLVFLGDQSVSVLDQLWRDVCMALQTDSVGALSTFIDSVGAFPDATSAILAAEFVPSDRLAVIHQLLACQCQGLNLQLDNRTFRPHITLARLRKSAAYGDQSAFSAGVGFELPVTIPFCCRELVLYTSEQSVSGSVYRTYASIDLV
ncbi:MAG: RNA 2',3'-cyclic phosphodiesterase [Pseudomonadales bacterium]|nr:RNA 2',3'-cyclic phosphodiesterase [Pseudomonadales bacterium]